MIRPCIMVTVAFLLLCDLATSIEYAHPAVEKELTEKRRELKQLRVELDRLHRELVLVSGQRDAAAMAAHRNMWFVALAVVACSCAVAYAFRVGELRLTPSASTPLPEPHEMDVQQQQPTAPLTPPIPPPPPPSDKTDDISMPFHGLPTMTPQVQSKMASVRKQQQQHRWNL